MDYPKEFRWNEKFFEPVKNFKVDENRNFCITISIVRLRNREGEIDEPILMVKRWRRRKDKKTGKLYYRPSRGFGIRNKEQYRNVVRGLKLGSEIKWGDIEDIEIEDYRLEEALIKLLKKNPDTAIKFLNEIGKFIEESGPEEIEFISRALRIFRGVDSELVKLLSALVSKLSKQAPESLKQLDDILNNLSLFQVNAFTRYVYIRLQALEVFGKLITNKETYEYKGRKESMHRFLENNPWILGEDYELLTSNNELKTLIIQEVGKKVKNARERPDFALVDSGDKKLVIVEIKRPDHSLTLDDAQQLMKYRAIAEKHIGGKYGLFQGFLIGGKLSYDLEVNKDGFKCIQIKTYTNMINKIKKRYKDLLEVYKKKNVATL